MPYEEIPFANEYHKKFLGLKPGDEMEQKDKN